MAESKMAETAIIKFENQSFCAKFGWIQMAEFKMAEFKMVAIIKLIRWN